MKLTVASLLLQPYMNGTRLLAGKKGLSHPVECVSFAEVPSAPHNLLKNTLLLTDASFFDLRDPDALARTFAFYQTAKVSALGLKLPDGAEPPEDFLRRAEQAALPVLALPADVILSSVISGVSYEIFYRNGYNLYNSYEDNFIQEMILTEQDRQMLVKRARMMGIKVDEYLGVLLIAPQDVSIIPKIHKICKDAWDTNCFICSRNGMVMVIARMQQPFESTRGRLHMRAEELFAYLKRGLPGKSFHIGVGHCYEDVSHVRKSYYEARTALISGKMARSSRGLFFYDEMGIYRILFDLKNREQLYEIQEETVHRLKKYDAENGTAFTETIHAYFAAFCSVQKTAKALYVHYNTIRYRMERIKALFGWDLMNLSDCVYLYVGFHVDEYLEESQA